MEFNEFRTMPGPLLIFGAGPAGEEAAKCCRALGLDVLAIIDNDPEKVGQITGQLPVYRTPYLPGLYLDARIIIAVADIADVVRQLNGMGYRNFYPAGQLLETLAPSDDTDAFRRYRIEACIACHKAYLNPGRVFLRSVDIVVTERCSLRCRDCANLMQRYREPQTYPVGDVTRAIHDLFYATHAIHEFRFIGGEPLLHPDLHKLVGFSVVPGVEKLLIYTNGTLSLKPEQIDAFCTEQVLFIITRYPGLSRRIDDLIAILRAHGIAYVVQPAGAWTKCCEIEQHQRTNEDNRDLFLRCCSKNTFTLLKGKLYRCPFAAHGANLGLLPDEGIALNTRDAADRVKAFLAQDLWKHCDFCTGRTFDAPKIPAAVQGAVD